MVLSQVMIISSHTKNETRIISRGSYRNMRLIKYDDYDDDEACLTGPTALCLLHKPEEEKRIEAQLCNTIQDESS